MEIVEFLLKNGANIMAMNSVDMTPLHLAARDGQTEVVRFIVEMGSDISERVIDDVLYVARMSVHSNEAIYKMIYDYRLKIVRPSVDSSDDVNEVLLVSAENGDLASVVKALEAGADPDVMDGRGMRPLLWAALRGHFEIVKHLLDHGADLHKTNTADWTALMEASMGGHLEIVKLLLERGADVNAKTFVSGTALMFSAGNGHIEVVKSLLSHGADHTIRIDGAEDDDGMTALDYARRFGRWDIVELLETLG